MSGVPGIPAATQKHLEPGTEVHWKRRQWHTDVAQVAGRITGRDIQATAERDCEVHEVTADPLALRVDVERSLRGPRELVAELYVRVDPVANGLDPRPAGRRLAEQLPGQLRHPVHLAITAGQ